jgi:hypothetical protein
MTNRSELRKFYLQAKSAKIGQLVSCPSCGEMFEKKYYHQCFCQTKPGTTCKDFYWNNITPTKRNNTKRISPANARYYNNVILPNKVYRSRYDDEDLGWDAHKDTM